MTMIEQHVSAVQARIRLACQTHGRAPGSVRLLAVSKTFGPEALQAAYACGQRAFGENYIQEALGKMQALHPLAIEWHCIGPVQSNKTRQVAEHFDWVQSVDRLKIAQRLSEQRPAGLPPLQVCIQVNVDGGATKSGVPPGQTLALAQGIAALPRLQLRGLMCIPEPAPDSAASCAVLSRAKALFDDLNQAGFALDTLSMGMSTDLEAAVASGSTMLRVGSAIFGARAYPV